MNVSQLKYKLSVIVFTFVASLASAQLHFRSITIDQGLPHNFTQSIVKDQAGFVWIATNNGLARFDGYTFKTYFPDDSRSYSLTHSNLKLLFPDSKGNIWISISSGGINKFDLTTERVKSYFYDITETDYLLSVVSFFEDKDSILWITNSKGIYRYNKSADAFEYVLLKKQFKTSENYIENLVDDKKGNIWFVVDRKVGILNKKTLSTTTWGNFSGNVSLDTIKVNTIALGTNGLIWLATSNNGLAAHNTANNQVEFLLRSVKNISSVYVDRKNRVYAVTGEPYNILYASDNAATTNSNFQQAFPFGKTKSNFYLEFNEDISGNVWISSSNGLARFSFSTGSDLFKSHKNEPFSLSRNEIDNFYIGNDNVLWVSPIRQGINKADLYQKPFNHILPLSVSDTGSEPNVNVSSVYAEPNGNIWMGMNNNKVCVYVANEKKMYQTIIPSDNITSIFDDGMGNIWFGSYSIFLHKGVKSSIVWDKKSAQFRFAKLEKYNTMGVRKIARDSVGNMWFASSLGLVCKPFASNQFINYSQQLDSLNNFSTFYRYVFVDKKQQIWTASNNGGLSSFNTKTHTFKHFLNSSTNSNSISSNRTYAIYQDKQGLLWVGTGSGLDIFNPITQTFTRAGNNGALSKYRIFSILPDTCGNLWLSSDLGIIRYNIKTKLNTFYGREQGLPVTEFHTTASGIGSNGNLYYGGIDGLLSFNPMQIHNNPIKPLPTITALRVANRYFSPGDSLNGRVLFNKAIHKVNTLIFKYNEVDFSIEFSALHYAAPENCTYQYMLKGFNNEWQYTNASNRQVSYTGLPHGNYVFMLNAFNNDGLANDPEKMVRLNIIITPPFWRTIWFRIIVFFVYCHCHFAKHLLSN